MAPTTLGMAERMRELQQTSTAPAPFLDPKGKMLDRMSAVPPPKRHPYDQWSPDARALDLVGDKWTLLIVRDLAAGPRRFVELQRVLPGISTEQLRSRLNRMVADGLLTRQRYREVPPRVDYELTDRSRALLPVLGELARWGYEWAWGPPRPGEAVDIAAFFRVAPGLIAPGEARGVAELLVHGPEHEQRYLVHLGEGEVSVRECDPRSSEGEPEPDARVEGSQDEWVAALGTDSRRERLELSGDERLAGVVLDGLSAASSRALRAA